MNRFRDISDIRREYGELNLDEHSIAADPLAQFKLWFAEVLATEKNDPTAMVLATVDEQGHPDTRVVLLKGFDEGHFIFYTNYQSIKAIQIEHNPYAAINFYWPEMVRQVRVRGHIEKVSDELSDQYFASRPLKSQLGAVISPQSREIPDRAFLEKAFEQHTEKEIKRPEYWGGYRLIPDEIEFWQGRDNRLHDRIQYKRQNNAWDHRRLAP